MLALMMKRRRCSKQLQTYQPYEGLHDHVTSLNSMKILIALDILLLSRTKRTTGPQTPTNHVLEVSA